MLPGFSPAHFGVLFCIVVFCCWYTPNLLDHAVSGAQFLTRSVTLLIVDLLKFCVCCISSGVTLCTHLTMHYLDRMCQCRLCVVPWSHISILMRHLTAEPRRTAGLLFPSQCPSGTILLTPYLMVWDWQVSRAGPMLFYWPKLLYPYYSLLLFFPFSSSCLKFFFVGLGSLEW